jgi:prepilin-type N-terminal cleavage/methylation domain-containing protein
MGATSEPRSRDLRGFTILEVMIVIGILSFGLLSLSAMQIHAMKGGNQGRHATRAAALAESEMEFLQYASWTSGAIDPTTGWTAPETRQTDVQVDGGTGTEQDYSLSYRVTDLEPTFTRAIDIEVSWTEPGGKARSIILSSVRFNREGI